MTLTNSRTAWKHRVGRRGWTLIEASVTMATSAVVIATLTSLFVSTLQYGDAVRERGVRRGTTYRLLDRLRVDLRAATNVTAGPDGKQLAVEGGDGSTVQYAVTPRGSCVRTGPRDAREAGTEFVIEPVSELELRVETHGSRRVATVALIAADPTRSKWLIRAIVNADRHQTPRGGTDE